MYSAMDNAPPAQSTLDSLRTVEFRLGLKGYNVDEVDEYLEKAAVEAEGLHEQLRQTADRLRQASERVGQLEAERRQIAAAPAPVEAPPDESLQRTLILAQKFIDQTQAEAEAEAAETVAQAEERARLTLAEAEAKARQLSADTERHLREEVSRLESLRGQLANDVENMARHLEAERNRLRTALTEVLRWVDDNVQPAAALMAQRPRSTEAARPSSAGVADTPSGQYPETTTDDAPAAEILNGEAQAGVLDLSGGTPSHPEPGLPAQS
jgi:cell division initiation protein